MFLPDDYEQPGAPECSEMTRRRLEYMISNALIYNRLEYEMRSAICTEDEALGMIAELSQQMPIMGLHSVPLDMRQQGDAIRYMVAKDDFYEQRTKKDYARNAFKLSDSRNQIPKGWQRVSFT